MSGRSLRDHTFEWLEKAYAERPGCMEYIKAEDFLEPFHSDPRYIDLLRRMGLPLPASARARSAAGPAVPAGSGKPADSIASNVTGLLLLSAVRVRRVSSVSRRNSALSEFLPPNFRRKSFTIHKAPCAQDGGRLAPPR
jgi:hypothetical protein